MGAGGDSRNETLSDDVSPVVRRSHPARRFAPRWGLRSLLIFGVLFSLAFAWIGKGLYRVRQEDAALIAIQRAGGTISLDLAAGSLIEFLPPGAESTWASDVFGDPLQRAIGWTERPAILDVAIGDWDAEPSALQAGVAALPTFPEIPELALRGDVFDDRTVEALDRLPGLEVLDLNYREIAGERLAKLKAPERFRELRLVNHTPASDFLPSLSAMSELRDLRVDFYRHLTRDDVAAIAALPKLERLELVTVTPVGDDVYAPIARAKTVRELSIVAVDAHGFDEGDLQAISELPQLEELLLDGLTETNLAAFQAPPGLRVFTMSNGLEPTAARKFAAQGGISAEAAQRFSAEHPLCEVRCIQDDGIVRRYFFIAGEPIDPPEEWASGPGWPGY